MSNRYGYGYGRGWGNWNGWNNSWNGWNRNHSWGSWKGWNSWSNPHWGASYSHYHHVPRRSGGFGILLTIGLAFWAGDAYTRYALEGRNRGGENQMTVQQTPLVGQTAASVDQVAPIQQQNQNQQNEFDYRKSWKSWRKCRPENIQLHQCLNNNDGEISTCQSFFDSIKECEKKYL